MPHWIIDLERNEVRHPSGQHARLRRRQFAVLMHLARRHDHLVSKDELIATNWHGLAVSEDSLTKCISEIRQALGPSLRHSLRTLSGRGYMLTGWRAGESGRMLLGPDAGPGAGRLPAGRPLVGRDDDMARVTGLVRGARLVTIAGSGGVGKTSLATAVANLVATDFADGAVFVPLAPLLPGGAVAAAIAAALRIAISGDPLAAVLAETMDRQQLLVLDNCEHVIEDAAAVVSRLLAEAPGLKVLATSREPLALEDESLFRLRPLDCPPDDLSLDAQDALAYPAIELLVRRAEGVAPGFVFGDGDVSAAAEICRRLDGIPLAIVLAAAQLRAMRLAEVAQGLDRRFDLLAGGPRDAGERQRTLRAMVKWSVDLLTAGEQELFAELGVFAAPATAEDIAAVCRVGGEPPSLAQIVSLTERSLLNPRRAEAGPTRYGYLETTRHFALERLAGNKSVWRRHAAHLAATLQRAEAALEVSSTEAWLDAYRPCLDDLRAALAWSFSADGDSALAVELAARGATLLDELSLQSERRALIEQAEALAQASVDPAMLGRLKLWRALRTNWVVWDGGLSHEAAALFARSGEALWEGRARATAAASDAFVGDWDRVWSGFDAAEQLLRPFGNTRSLSNMLRYRATILIWQQRLNEALLPLQEATQVADAIGYFRGSLRARATQAEIHFEEGDLEATIAAFAWELPEVRARGTAADVQLALTFLAACKLLIGEAGAAAEALQQALVLDRRLGDRWAASLHVELTGFYLAVTGDLAGAAALTAFGRAAGSSSDRPPERYERVVRARMEDLLAALSPEVRRDAEARGTAWTPDEAMATALERLQRGGIQEKLRQGSGL